MQWLYYLYNTVIAFALTSEQSKFKQIWEYVKGKLYNNDCIIEHSTLTTAIYKKKTC